MKHFIILLISLTSLYSCENTETVSVFTTTPPPPKEGQPIVTGGIHHSAKQLVDDNTIYDFLNAAITTDTLNLRLCNTIIGQNHIFIFIDKAEANYILRTAKVFTAEDREYIYKQSLYSTQFKINKLKLKTDKNIIIPETCDINEGNKDYWHNIRKQFGSFCSLSMPLFSKDKQTVVLRYSYSCGMLCAHGGYYVFRKENNTWTLTTILNKWVS
ncbi:hypothetical protein ACLI1A_01645 [Flavobacterium sp. RHBU_3]|uniref:hypothetical protein n=1 Tax=Flavobacterium sp. RHBU_3 TaxID=3391184 RepID=UPI003984E0BF